MMPILTHHRLRAPARRLCAAALALLLAATGLPGPAWAHGGEDHSHDAAPSAAPAAAPAPGAAPGATPGDVPRRLPDGSLFLPKTLQRQLGIRTLPLRRGTLAAAVELQGSVLADPQAGGRVQAPFAGIVEPGPKGMPVTGRQVVKGELLAYLRPVAGSIERSNQRARLAELDAELALATKRVARLEQLEGAVPRKDIEAAGIEQASLQQRRALIAASVDHAEPLRAPVSGVLTPAQHLLAGQIVDARETLFEIVDPKRLVVEALAYDPALIGSVQSASAYTGTSAGEQVLALAYLGGGQQLRAQALPLLFRIVGPTAGVAVGQPVRVLLRSSRGVQGQALPRQALTRAASGEAAAWVHVEPERFVLRRLRTQPLDAGQVVATEGLSDGERVVTQGAHLLSQLR